MRIPTYRFRVDYVTVYSEFNPLLLFAQKYAFTPGESCLLRICCASAVILVESGKGELELNGSSCSVQTGTLIYIAAGTVHRWTADPDTPMVHRCVYFDWKYVSRPEFSYQRDYFGEPGSFRTELISPQPELELQGITGSSSLQLWISYFNALTPPPELLGQRNPWDKLAYNGAFQMFLHQFIAGAVKNGARDPRISRILARIEKEPPALSEQCLYEWAEALGLKKSRFHDLFKSDTGYTPNHYLKRLKFHRIAEDLVYSNLSITGIAAKHGFSSVHYFSKAFRLMTGLPPSEYREKYTGMM
ncbi:helix-turn-helix domain-containing protein [Paenibacillus tengchongensis]|uniref:helix-turn-helix domain-containing protein n=1 Tax=Paenibacillus tengchongensis TaxID=2608684 RepID=UPI00124CCB2D|nr:helix-turn-helix domain-containing protein [Paenibacillus tengchongensis]